MNVLLNSIINGPAHYSQSHHLSNDLTIVVVLGALVAEIVVAWLIVLLTFKAIQNFKPFISFVLRRFNVGREDSKNVFLELTFPATTTKSAYATEQLHILLRHHMASQSRLNHLAAYKRLHSLELYSTKDKGIRYIVVVPETEVEYIEHSLRSYLPGLKIKQVPDYLKLIKGSTAGVVELRLSNDYVLPLKDHKALEEHDFMAYLTGHMTKLNEDGLIGLQIVVTPVLNNTHHRVNRHVKRFESLIARGQSVGDELTIIRNANNFYLWLLWYPLYWFISTMMKVVTGLFDILVTMFSKDHNLPGFMRDNNKLPSDNPYANELSKSVKSKIDQPLFEVSIRVLVASKDKSVITNRLESILATFKPFTTTRQSITNSGDNASLLIKNKHLFDRYKTRVLSLHFPDQQTILSSSELSDLYHFPNTDLTRTEDLVKSRSTELPAPLSIKRSDTDLDVIVGVNKHGGDERPIGMTLEQRQKHTYIIGKTGMGKTTMLTNMIYQDMLNGKGLAVLDPHGDMFKELLGLVPKHRLKDVVVFDPSDRDYPLGLNIFDPGIAFISDDDKKEWIASSLIDVFKKLSDQKQWWGPKMEHNLRSAVLTALEQPNPSLYTIQRLLTEKSYQRTVAKDLKDPVLKQFWAKEFRLLGNMQLANEASPLTHRIGRFITTKMSRHILLQETSTLRIADIMNEGKILLVNLSKGDIGEDQSYFFGTLLSALIWMAAFQRTKIPEKDRRDFFLYIDEFQNFATPQFMDIISEGRKFHISLILSHQNIAQIADQNLLESVATNAHNLITLKVGPKDEAFMLPHMRPVVEKGDMINLAPYHFYMKTTYEESEDAFSGETVPLDVLGSSETKQKVINYSRNQYALTVQELEESMDKLFAGHAPKRQQRKNTTKKSVKSQNADNNSAGKLKEM